ncbi:MAG: flagellar protein FliT, partial [Pseudomonadota bacterium]
LTRERERSLAEGDLAAAQTTERRRLSVAKELFRTPGVLIAYPALRQVIEDILAADERAKGALQKSRQAVGEQLGALRRGRQAADAYQREAGQ